MSFAGIWLIAFIPTLYQTVYFRGCFPLGIDPLVYELADLMWGCSLEFWIDLGVCPLLNGKHGEHFLIIVPDLTLEEGNGSGTYSLSHSLVLLTQQFRILNYQLHLRHVNFYVTLASIILYYMLMCNVATSHSRSCARAQIIKEADRWCIFRVSFAW